MQTFHILSAVAWRARACRTRLRRPGPSARSGATRRSLRFACLAIGLLALAAALPPAETARAEEPVAIALDENYPPYMYRRDGEPAGFYYDLLREIFDQMLVPVRFEMQPWTAAIARIDQAEAGLAGLYKNDERFRKYDFSNAIIEEQLVVYVRKGDTFRFETVDDLAGKTIAIIRGWSYGQTFDSARQRGVFATVETGSATESLRKIYSGAADAGVIESLSARIAMKMQLDLKAAVEPLPTPVATNKTYLAFNKEARKTALLDYFNYVMKTMKSDGRFETILLESVNDNAVIPTNQ